MLKIIHRSLIIWTPVRIFNQSNLLRNGALTFQTGK